MTEYKKRVKYQSDDGGLHESEYDRLLRTGDHHFCLWNNHGDGCQNSAAVLTTVLASKAKHLPGGQHQSVIKGGYCSKHNAMLNDFAASNETARVGKDWRDLLVNSYLECRASRVGQ